MKFKLDENLGFTIVEVLKEHNYDVSTIYEQKLNSAPDKKVIDICHEEGRCLITLDLDFANPFIYPPENYSGIVVLRVSRKIKLEELIQATKTFIEAIKTNKIIGNLWIVSSERIRIYQRN